MDKNLTTMQSVELGRRTLLKGAAWATPAIVATASAPLLAATQPSANFSVDCFRATEVTQKLSGEILDHTATLAFNNRLKFDTATCVAATPEAGPFTYAVVATTLLMNDGASYSTTPGIAGQGSLGETIEIGPLAFPDVRIVDPATIEGTVKYMRYPEQVQALVDVVDTSTDVVQAVLFTWNLTNRPTEVQFTGTSMTITYEGKAVPE